MERIGIDSVDAPAFGDGVERRCLGDALGTRDVAINHYTVPSGERLAGLHAHADQAELFVVLDGAVVFETLEGPLAADGGEAVRFRPGEFQSCTNPDGAGEAVVLALGAPRNSDDVRVPVGCSDCGSGEHRLELAGGEERLVCSGCGAETAPECPECGGDDLRVVLDAGGRPVERCRDCEATTPAR